MKLKHILLGLSLVALAVGFSGGQPAMYFSLGFPVGVVLFGLFLITQAWEKEWALYDKQDHAPEVQPARSAPVRTEHTFIGGGTPSRSHQG